MGKKARRPGSSPSPSPRVEGAAPTAPATATPPPPQDFAQWRAPFLIVLLATVRLADRYRRSSLAPPPDLKPLVATNPPAQPLVLVADALFNKSAAAALRKCALEHPLTARNELTAMFGKTRGVVARFNLEGVRAAVGLVWVLLESHSLLTRSRALLLVCGRRWRRCATTTRGSGVSCLTSTPRATPTPTPSS